MHEHSHPKALHTLDPVSSHPARRAERRTRWVVAVTLAMMALEIAAGLAFGSKALLADGWHMGTHAAALLMTAFAYAYARKHGATKRYSFGTGKIGALGGFASAVGLAMVAAYVAAASLSQVASPATIRFDEAIGVAVLGLLVNLVCAALLHQGLGAGNPGAHGAVGHSHAHLATDHPHGHPHRDHHSHPHHHGAGREHGHPHLVLEHAVTAHGHVHAHPDLNLRGAYLHVAADALTSVAAIVALVAGKVMGWTWMDPLMGVAGAALILRWSLGLMRETSGVLLDEEANPEQRSALLAAIEREAGTRVTEMRLWRIGDGRMAATVSLVSAPPRPPAHYRELLRGLAQLEHVTIEVNPSEMPSSGAVA